MQKYKQLNIMKQPKSHFNECSGNPPKKTNGTYGVYSLGYVIGARNFRLEDH